MRDFKTGRRLLTCACLMLLAAAAAEAKAWRRIVPLRTTRAQVERRLGKPNPRNQRYEFPAESAFIIYASGDGCAQGAGWNVRRGTVVSIVVTPKTRLHLSSLRLDLTKFTKTLDPETPAHALYTNEAEGVTYHVFEEAGEYQGRVQTVTFGPSARDRRRRCPDQRPAATAAP